MSTDAKRYKVTIFGDQYSLLSDEQNDQIPNAAAMIDDLMHDIAQQTSLNDAKHIAILAALQVATKLQALEKKEEQFTMRSDRLVEALEKELSLLQ